jgi:uncharacterized LabA/DUF88 family protein
MAVCLVGFTLRPVASTGNLISEIAPHSTNPKGSRMGLFYLMATPAQPLVEPAIKRAVAFIDGQNLFHHARQAFGYHYPNYDIKKLFESVCKAQAWDLTGIRFYTGVPDPSDDPFWNHFWVGKLASMGRQGIKVFSRSLRYRNKTVKMPNGTIFSFLHGEEKGIDVRIALDIIGMAVRNQYDVALVFSQDQDLSEVADEIRVIARQQSRWIRIACAYPLSPTSQNRRGINGSQWIPIDRATYDACLDPKDYRK